MVLSERCHHSSSGTAANHWGCTESILDFNEGTNAISAAKIKVMFGINSRVNAKLVFALRKLAHAINRDFLALKIEHFQLNKFDIFLIFAQNIDCGYTSEPPRRDGSNEYPQSMFWSKNKKNNCTPAYPTFTI